MHLPGWDDQLESQRSGIAVEVRRLDEFIDSEIGVMKLDVEFHEAQVLKGAGKLLPNIRDIVFEEIGPYPQESHKILERAGFRIVWFEEHLLGLKMIEPTSRPKCAPTTPCPVTWHLGIANVRSGCSRRRGGNLSDKFSINRVVSLRSDIDRNDVRLKLTLNFRNLRCYKLDSVCTRSCQIIVLTNIEVFV